MLDTPYVRENISTGVEDIEDTRGHFKTDVKEFHAEEELDKLRGFIKYKRHDNLYRPADKRINDWKEIYDYKAVRKTIKTQAARCMDCGVPTCQSFAGCPLGNIIPKWNDLVFTDNWLEALETLLQTNNFPEFTGRVCPAPCEAACVLGINEKPVNIKNIECSIIDHAFEKGWIRPDIQHNKTGKYISIIGSGPSGLAAAAQLIKAGHRVTVYERSDYAGGLLQYGIPSMKLSKEIVQRRINLLRQEGVVFKTGVEVGDTISAKCILGQSDALLVATGSTSPRGLNIPGKDLKGVHFAMEFLKNWQQSQMLFKPPEYNSLLAKDKKVVVIGGGDTGVDCIATSLRQDAKDITTFEILPKPPVQRSSDNPWPEWPKVFKVDYGHEESIIKQGRDPRVYGILTKKFIESTENPGHISGVLTVKVDWQKDANGSWKMKELENSEKIYDCDMVLLAMGFLGPEKKFLKDLEIELDVRTNIATNPNMYQTNIPKVYAAGDCHRGQSLVVWAINEGRQAARQIDLDLMGHTSLANQGALCTLLITSSKISVICETLPLNAQSFQSCV